MNAASCIPCGAGAAITLPLQTAAATTRLQTDALRDPRMQEHSEPTNMPDRITACPNGIILQT